MIPSKWGPNSFVNQRKWLLSVALQVSMIAVIFIPLLITVLLGHGVNREQCICC